VCSVYDTSVSQIIVEREREREREREFCKEVSWRTFFVYIERDRYFTLRKLREITRLRYR
jgi:hypothetical protein